MSNQTSMARLGGPKLVELLRKGGFRDMTEERLAEDAAAGMPVNADGTYNLIHCIAWYAREVNDNGSEPVQA